MSDSEKLNDFSNSSDEYVPSNDEDDENDSNMSSPIPHLGENLNEERSVSSNLEIVELLDERMLSNSYIIEGSSIICENAAPTKSSEAVVSSSVEDLYAEALFVNIKKPQARKTKTGKTYDKVEYCPICLKPGMKIWRHISKVHAEHPDVLEAEGKKEEPALRNALIRKLITKGNQINNTNNIRLGKGQLVTKRRPASTQDAPPDPTAYAPCPFCYNWLKKTYLYRHKNKCKVLREDGEFAQNNFSTLRHIRSQAAFLLPSHHEIDQALKVNVLKFMKDDDVLRLIRNDEAILEYGKKMYDVTGNVNEIATTRHHVAQKMRELARFLGEGQKITGDSSRTLLSFLRPNQTPTVIQILKNIGECNETEQMFKIPSTVIKIVQGIRKVIVQF